MKNIYLIPTDKPSRLYSNNGQLHLDSILQNSGGHTINQHIYITNDEKPKKDYFLSLNDDESYLEVTLNNEVDNFDNYADKDWTKNCKKVILTTDPDLIADGVQSIDDEFLQWFINNNSCESIKTLWTIPADKIEKEYRIEIPKEEPKQPSNFYEELKNHFENTPREELLEEWEKSAESDKVGPTVEEFLEHSKQEPNYNMKQEILAEMERIEKSKQETVEEAAENQWGNVHRTGVLGFIEGAKWQEERMYSKEDLISFAFFYFKEEFNSVFEDAKSIEEIFSLWFEQFKKK